MAFQHSWRGKFPTRRIYVLRCRPAALALVTSMLALSACGGGGSDGGFAVLPGPTAQPGPVTPEPASAALPKCAELPASPFFVGNAQVVDGTLKTSIVSATAATASVPATPAFCRVEFAFTSGLQGPRMAGTKGSAN